MEQRRLTRKEIIDWIVAKATIGMFTGDKRDREAPPITIQNFTVQAQRYGAKALRARLSRLSFEELLTEARGVLAYFKARPSELEQIAERVKRDEAKRVHSHRQSEFAKKPRLQIAIVAAARHCRNQRMNAGEAWDALKKAPFETDDGNTVEIEGTKLPRIEQRMRVISRGGRQRKRPISFSQWRQRYWPAAT
jgi:hypothetical protein